MKSDHTGDEPFGTRQLRVLATIAQERSLSAAARRLHLTQSAVSHALKKLEADAGACLVERNERGAELTQAGQALARRAEAVFEQMRQAREELHQLKHWGARRLRFGASSTVCQYLLPAVLNAFNGKHPNCRVEVSAGDGASRLAGLREGRVDLAIMTHSDPEPPDIEQTAIFRETLCRVTKAGAPGADLPYIGYHRGSSLSRDAMLWFDQNDQPRPQPTMELESLEAIKAMVKLGLGFAVMPEWVVRRDALDGTLAIDPGARPFSRPWSLAMRRGHRLSLSESDWAACCAEGLRTLS